MATGQCRIIICIVVAKIAVTKQKTDDKKGNTFNGASFYPSPMSLFFARFSRFFLVSFSSEVSFYPISPVFTIPLNPTIQPVGICMCWKLCVCVCMRLWNACFCLVVVLYLDVHVSSSSFSLLLSWFIWMAWCAYCSNFEVCKCSLYVR